MTGERQRIRNPKSHFTIVPNQYDDADLTVYQFRLLLHYRRVGNCFEAIRTTAAKCRMSVGSVVNARNELAVKGWIAVAHKADGAIHVAVLDRWTDATPTSGGTGGERSPGEQEEGDCSPSERDVHDVNGERSPGGTEEVLVLKKDFLKKRRPGTNDQTPLAQVKALILDELVGGKPYRAPPRLYDLAFEPLVSVDLLKREDGAWATVLGHPDPSVIDSGLLALLQHKYFGVLGGPVDVRVVQA